MKTTLTNLLRTFWGLTLGVMLTAGIANAQTPTASNNSPKSAEPGKTEKVTETQKTEAKKSPTPRKETVPTSQTVGEDAGDYTVTSSIELGVRGQRVDGDVNKFKSDLNYKAGVRLFDSTFLMKSKDGGKGDLFDTLMITSTGWGADSYGNLRVSVEKPELYRFEGTYRRFKYYRFLNNIANPTWLFTPIATQANPVSGLHSYDLHTQMGDFDLTLLPKNERIRFNVGFSPERSDGPAYTNYHNGGNDFWMIANTRLRANDFRIGAEGRIGGWDWTILQGFRRFREDTTIDNEAVGLNRNTATSVAQSTSFLRSEPTRGSVDFTRISFHTLVEKKLDIVGRYIYSTAKSNSTFLESVTGRNFNYRVTGWPPTPPAVQPNTLNLGAFNIAAEVKRPSHIVDFGLTWLASDKFRLSNTFRLDRFTIDGLASFSDFFSITRPITGGTRTDTFGVTNLPASTVTRYSKYQNTFEGDYQFDPRYSMHFGYRLGHRSDLIQHLGFGIGSNSPTLGSTIPEIEENTTHAFFGGFRARPKKNWTVYFDAERGAADNVFTRIGNYDYTNVRAKTRIAPSRKLALNFSLILRDNANPSEIAGVSLSDFGVNLKTRVFTSSIDWTPNSNITVNAGYNYNWVNSDTIIDYFYQVPPAASVRHPNGQALYFQRLSFFFADLTARLNRRMTLFTSVRINNDNGQGNRLSDPAGTPGTIITSYPMTFLTPEARLAIRINRHFDWNVGYQYYAYNESDFLTTFPGASVRAQNYHAHLPYMSLRLYFGRKE
ncbi:MAG: hypothetical protein ACXW18_09255 [Pyrinomonadaceae bacterium]